MNRSLRLAAVLGVSCALLAPLGPASAGVSTARAANTVAAQGNAGTVGTGAVMKLATWNFCNHTCPGYAGRLRKLTRTIGTERPDVLALQEVDVRGGRLPAVQRALAQVGYVNTNPGAMQTCPKKCEAHVFIRRRTMQVVTDPQGRARTFGILPMGQVSGRARGNPASFAFVTHRASGAKMMAVSLHFDKQNGSRGFGADDRARNAAAAGLARWSTRRSAEVGLRGVPTALMGDYNSYQRKQPRGPQWVLSRLGFVNADRARVRVGRQFPTINKLPMDARWRGFPPRPRRFVAGGPQIDAIMLRGVGRALRHEISIRRTGGGRFDQRFQASDHNLVVSTVRVPV